MEHVKSVFYLELKKERRYQNMNVILSILVGSLFVERVVDVGKMIVNKRKIQWQVILSMLVGILLSLAYHWNLPKEFGFISTIPLLGEVLTGLLMSGGSNFLYDLIKKILSMKGEINESRF